MSKPFFIFGKKKSLLDYKMCSIEKSMILSRKHFEISSNPPLLKHHKNKHMTVTILQSNLYWEDIQANLNQFEHKIATIKGLTDIIILPEMFSTGFSMNPTKLAEKSQGKTFNWLQQQASIANAVITGSYIVEEAGQYYQSFSLDAARWSLLYL